MGKGVNRKHVKRVSKPCRLCGKYSRTYKDIFKASIKFDQSSVNNVTNYSYKPISIVIQECLNFNVTKENQVSNIICVSCIKELTSWSKFQNQCLQQQSASGIKYENSQTINAHRNYKSKIFDDSVDSLVDNSNERDAISSSHVSKKKQKTEVLEKCSSCKSIFKNLNEQSIHQKTEEGCLFTCFQCLKQFRSKDVLRNHLEIHSDSDNFCCHICGLLFLTRNRLHHHFQSHKTSKQFQCNYCSKEFSYTYDLEKHIRTHTGERPFKCEECGATFTQNSLMVRHVEAVHKKSKRFTCSECSKSFLYKNNFEEHLMLHSGQKDIVCKVCNKAFVTKNGLVRHQRNHTGEKPYPCPECDKRFADCSNRKRHVLQHHKNNNPDTKKKVVFHLSKKKGKLQECKVKKIINRPQENKPLPTLKTFLEDPELLLGTLSDKRDDSLSNFEEMSRDSDPSNVFDCNVFTNNENSPHSDIQPCENNTLTLTVLDEDDRSLEFLSSHTLLQYDSILPRIEEDNFLEIKNKLISNGIEQPENYAKLEELLNQTEIDKDELLNQIDIDKVEILNETDVDKVEISSETDNDKVEILIQTDVDKIKLSNIQCQSLSSTDVLNLELALGTFTAEQVDIQQRWAADVLNNIAPCETQSILKMLNNQGTVLLTFPETEDFSV